jgi:putative FmdB family regulatory protein
MADLDRHSRGLHRRWSLLCVSAFRDEHAMPNYDYVCQSCGHRFEVYQSMNDAKLRDCPVAGCGGTVKRLLGTGAGLIFKGSGFYQTDYRSDSYQQGAKQDSAAAKPADAPAPAAPAATAATPAAPAAPSKSGE